jgi:hypothetical protein
VKTKFGTGLCPGCKAAGRTTRVVFRSNELETLSYNCDECDAPDYARKGTQKHADWLKVIERLKPEAPAPAAKPAPVPPAARPAPAAPAAKMPWVR